MKNHIFETLLILDQDKRTGKYLRWEYLKYLKYLKNKDRNFLEKELKNLTNFQTNQYCVKCKQKLKNIYIKKVNGITIRSKCNWYEIGEKSTKSFLNLEKYRANQGCLRTIIVNKKELNNS